MPACDEATKQFVKAVDVADFGTTVYGVPNLLMMCAALEGWRQVSATDRHAGAVTPRCSRISPT